MSDVNFQRSHALGLEKARELAQQWVATSAAKLGLDCQHKQGADQDTITFERMGVKGTMKVTATEFDLNIKLGMMMAALKPMIEAEVAKNRAASLTKPRA